MGTRSNNWTMFWVVMACAVISHVQSDCVMYGPCGSHPANKDHKISCEYNGPPKPLQTSTAKKAFMRNCPDLYTGDVTNTCCDDEQVMIMDSQLGVPRMSFQRCPSCLHNFLNIWCQVTCGPKQSDWLKVRTSFPRGDKQAVLQVDYYITPEFGEGMFNSCKNVVNPSSNAPAIDLMCGATEHCTTQKWLDYMGSTSNTQAPYDIFFHISDENVTSKDPKTGAQKTIVPLNHPVVPCSKALNNRTEPCSCQDCRDSCDSSMKSGHAPPSGPCTIDLLGSEDGETAEVDCYVFGASIFFVIFLVLFVCGYCVGRCCCKSAATKHFEDDGTARFEKKEKVYSISKKTDAISEDVNEHDLSFLEKFGAATEDFLEQAFLRWGLFITTRPVTIIVASLAICGVLCSGMALFKVTTDPVKLWSAANSRGRLEKDYYDSNFVPFYRTQQVIVSRPHNDSVVFHELPPPTVDTVNYTNIFDKTFLHQMLDLQLSIQHLEALHDNSTITLQDICFAPLEPDNKNCTIQSVLNYYQNSHQTLDAFKMDQDEFWVTADYLDHFASCVLNPMAMNDTTALLSPCLGSYGGPVFPWVALGGYEGTEYRTAKALVFTFMVSNHLNQTQNEPAKAWEAEFIRFMKNYTENHPELSIAFRAERSIEDELDRESRSDVMTILISYVIMFAYITLTLGQYSPSLHLLVDAKVTLGLCGVLMVLASVVASLGFYSYIGVSATLIIVEVVPFLVLAVGVDNIFIIVQTYQREKQQNGEQVEHMIARVVSKVGPSMLLTSLSESMAFFLGALTPMPAVQVFSLNAALAVFIDFLLQLSVFIALLTLDARRQRSNRVDAICCVKLPATNPSKTEDSRGGMLYQMVNNYYSHFLMHDWVRPVVMVVFVGYMCASCAMIPRIDLGLDQSLSMPKDSYVLSYFNNLSAYVSVGPPVYFVVKKGHSYSTYRDQNAICGVSGCRQDSLTQQISTAALLRNVSYIAQPTSSWLDDYFSWISSPECCRYYNDTGEFCPSRVKDLSCLPCQVHNMYKGRPVGEDFDRFLPWFLKDNPNKICSKGGHAAYGSGVHLYNDSQERTQVGASYFMTYHTPLKDSADFINALKEARVVAENISKAISTSNQDEEVADVFPYSIFYVFYEQYLTIVYDASINILICLAAILAMTFVLLGLDLHSSCLLIVVIVMILVDIMGLMYMWNIQLNALTVVNLIMAIGISVEFCSHTVRAFAVSTLPTRKARAKQALGQIGSSVLSGITLTKLVGIIVLAFSKTQLFQVFYFRMYVGIVVFGASTGLVFLPVLLSYCGPPVNRARYLRNKKRKEEEEEESKRQRQQFQFQPQELQQNGSAGGTHYQVQGHSWQDKGTTQHHRVHPLQHNGTTQHDQVQGHPRQHEGTQHDQIIIKQSSHAHGQQNGKHEINQQSQQNGHYENNLGDKNIILSQQNDCTSNNRIQQPNQNSNTIEIFRM